MGLMKRMLEEAQERGFDALPHDHVCDECFADEALAAFVREHAEEPRCDYCERAADKPIAAPTDAVMAAIVGGLRYEHARAVDELPWDGGDGGWQGAPTWDTYDVFARIGWPFVNEQLAQDVIAAIQNADWCEQITPGTLLSFDWERFVALVSHRQRFLFAPEQEEMRLLVKLGQLMRKHGLLRELPVRTAFSRVRVHGPAEPIRGAQDIGTPPGPSARANRMSGAGIPVFYGARDDRTAVVETVEPADVGTSLVTLGRFALTTPLLVVDLTAIPSVPSLFDAERRELRDELTFLDGFARDVSKPVRRDGSEHIEYVPTQIVCEYLRQRLADVEGRRPQGILFRSSARPEGTVAALFVGREDCLDEDAPAAGDRAQLRLSEAVRIDVAVHVEMRRTRELRFDDDA